MGTINPLPLQTWRLLVEEVTVEPSTVRWATVLAVAVGVEFLLGVMALLSVPMDRPSGWLPAKGEAVFLVHSGCGLLLMLAAIRAHRPHPGDVEGVAHCWVAGVYRRLACRCWRPSYGRDVVGQVLRYDPYAPWRRCCCVWLHGPRDAHAFSPAAGRPSGLTISGFASRRGPGVHQT